MKDRAIVMVGQQAWDLGIGSNAHNIAAEFALDNLVLYVNPPLDINTLLSPWKAPKIRTRLKGMFGLAEKLRQVGPNLWVYTPGIICLSVNWLPFQALYRLFNRLNNLLFARSIRHACRRLDIQRFVLFNDSLMFLGLEQKELLQPEKYIYYIRDYLITQRYFKRHGRWAEASLMRAADLVVANSSFLADYAASYNPKSYDIGQGCELHLFDPQADLPLPADLAPIPGPIVGYVGNLTGERLDISLLVKMARAKPAYSFVMVGFEDKSFSQSLLHTLPNVHFLGPKPPRELPAYIQHFDICINPQLINELTIGNYPRKVDEYLAMGKPVVATATEAMKLFSGFAYLGHSPSEHIKLLDQALVENNKARAAARMAFARSHTWKASVEAIYRALDLLASPAALSPGV